MGAICGSWGASGSLRGPKRAPERVLEGFLGAREGSETENNIFSGGFKSEKEYAKRDL